MAKWCWKVSTDTEGCKNGTKVRGSHDRTPFDRSSVSGRIGRNSVWQQPVMKLIGTDKPHLVCKSLPCLDMPGLPCQLVMVLHGRSICSGILAGSQSWHRSRSRD